MKWIMLLLLSLFFTNEQRAQSAIQSDTIFGFAQIIPCSIKEETDCEVKYSYVNEEALYSISKAEIEKIAFRSGRVEVFEEAFEPARIAGCADFNKVVLTKRKGLPQGFALIGFAGTRARAYDLRQLVDSAYLVACKQLKIKAAMYGANVVCIGAPYPDKNTIEGHTGFYPYCDLGGMAYTNDLPDAQSFLKRCGAVYNFKIRKISKMSKPTEKRPDGEFRFDTTEQVITLTGTNVTNGTLFLEGHANFVKIKSFGLTYFNYRYFILFGEDKKYIYNFYCYF